MLTLREARDQSVAKLGAGPDGGLSHRWVTLWKLGPIPVGFPNSDSRRRALPLHDLHHAITGYGTDMRGECEISAWELASGCSNFWFAWFINLQGLFLGIAIAPLRTLRAWVRGRHSKNLYNDPSPMRHLDRPLCEVRGEFLR